MVAQGSYYSGVVNFPESVAYMDRTRNVTSIDRAAFRYSDLISVTIPYSATSIGAYAFDE